MITFITLGQQRPSRILKAGEEKDKEYHNKFGRYCVSAANTTQQQRFQEKINVNRDFYRNKQWFFEEDTELFLKDETGQSRNRIAVTHNIIRPMVEQYRGNAIRMTINARVKSISPMAINRREERLGEMNFLTDVANAVPTFGPSLQKKFPIGKDKQETGQIFDNIYVDKFVTKMNYLLQFVAERNGFQQDQVRIAEELALSGLGVMKTFEYAGHQQFRLVPSDEYFFDRSAKKPDLTDAEFMGQVTYMLPTEIFEQFEVTDEATREKIEDYARRFWSNNKIDRNEGYTGRLPIVFSYWKDCTKNEWGYVMDEYGYPYLTKINFTYEGEDAPRYTDKDLIEVNTERAKKALKGKIKTNNYTDEIRYCVFIPFETCLNEQQSEKKGDMLDIVLDWGLEPYQETETQDYYNSQFPYKAYCWSYMEGEIMSPVDDAINPQRLINRILSISENQMNNSRGSGSIIDSSAVDPREGEQGILKNMSQSKPVIINAKGRGIQNLVSSYDSTIKQGTMIFYNIIDAIKNNVNGTTGVNDELRGDQQNADQLVGVTELAIQRGSLMQEPFYNAVSMVFMQCFQSIATKGKRIYADNERELAIATGDEGVEIIKITKDFKIEDFRAFVKRENDQDKLIQFGNQLLMQFKEMSMIDDTRYANLFNRSTADDIARELRAYSKEKNEMARMTNEQNQVKEQQIQQSIAQDKAEQDGKMKMMMKDNERLMDKSNDHKLQQIYAKGLTDLAGKEADIKNNFANSNKSV